MPRIRPETVNQYWPGQQRAHVDAHDAHTLEESRRWDRRLRGEEGPPVKFRREAVDAVLEALRRK